MRHIFTWLGLLIAIAGIYALFYSPVSKSKVTHTRFQIQQLYRLYEDSNQTEAERSCTPACQIIKILVTETSEPNNGTWEKDAWGNSLHIEFRRNISRTANPLLESTHLPIVIWSSGANGINELGKGDDVVFISQ